MRARNRVMRRSLLTVRVFVVTAGLLFVPGIVSAQAGDLQTLQQELDELRTEFEALRQRYEARLAELEQRLAALPAASEPAAAPEPLAAPEPAAAAAQPMPAGGGRVFNPDISVIADVQGVAGQNELSDQPSLSLSEVETSFQAVVDPYARGDFFLSVTPEGIEVEEGYITFTSLPAGILLKAGKMRVQFGKANTLHTHALPWADTPIVLQNLVSGEEPLADSGFSVSKLVPNGFMFLDAIGEVYQADSETFQSSSRSDLNYAGRLRGYRDLTESTNLDLGVSYTWGPSAAVPDFTRQLTGLDVTFRYRPLRRAIYRQFVGRTELVWSRQAMPGGPTEGAFGFYGSADYQFARRWYAGVRGDRSARPLDGNLRDSGVSAALTFRPSEFSLVRGQYRYTQYAEGVTANEVLFQLNFSIGAHGGHPF